MCMIVEDLVLPTPGLEIKCIATGERQDQKVNMVIPCQVQLIATIYNL